MTTSEDKTVAPDMRTVAVVVFVKCWIGIHSPTAFNLRYVTLRNIASLKETTDLVELHLHQVHNSEKNLKTNLVLICGYVMLLCVVFLSDHSRVAYVLPHQASAYTVSRHTSGMSIKR